MHIKPLIILTFSLIYFYSSLAAERTQWTAETLAHKVEETALRTYARIHETRLWVLPELGDALGSTDSTAWELTPRGIRLDGQIKPELALEKRPSFSLTAALKSLEESFTIVESMMVANFVSLKCLEALLGSDFLDQLCVEWEKHHKIKFYLSHIGYNSISFIFFDLNPISVLDWRGRGGFAYVSNDPNYERIAVDVTDVHHGENIVQVGFNSETPTYMGLNEETFSQLVDVEMILNCLKNSFDEAAKRRQLDINWDREKTLSCNRRTDLVIRTYSAHLINEFYLDPNVIAAEKRNSLVLQKYPLPEIVSDDEFDEFFEKYYGVKTDSKICS